MREYKLTAIINWLIPRGFGQVPKIIILFPANVVNFRISDSISHRNSQENRPLHGFLYKVDPKTQVSEKGDAFCRTNNKDSWEYKDIKFGKDKFKGIKPFIQILIIV